MAWGQLTIGALVLKETDILQDVTNANTGVRTVRVEGRETGGPSAASIAAVMAKHEDIMSLMDRVFTVKFERKAEYDGYYRFTDTNTELERWVDGNVQSRWSFAMEYLGPDNAVVVESLLASVVRLNDFTLAGERWHAPAAGHYGYHTGATIPAMVTRVGEAGSVPVYRGVPAGVNPRWGASVTGFQTGRVRLLVNGVDRVGTAVKANAAEWELNNGLVKVSYSGISLVVSAWTNGAWRSKNWRVGATVSSVTYEHFPLQMTVLRNDNEAVTVRLTSTAMPGPGVTLMDLTLRRGSRFVEGYVQQSVASSDIKVRLATAEAFTDNASSGYVVASSEDADGNKFVAGSARSFTGHPSGGALKLATATMDFFLGVVPGGELANPANNTGFEGGSAAGWVATGGTIVASQDFVKDGSWSGKLSASGSGAANVFQVEAVTALQSYRLSGWLYAPVALPTQATISLSWYAPGAAFISSSAINVSLVVGSWNWLDQTFTAPATAVSANKSFTINGAPPAGRLLYGDSVRIRKAPDSGDAATALRDQYIGAMAEKTGVSAR